ncbi:MAG: TonB-dependent receptor [Zoogloeaceae bacterium]|jgi:vitamin B12 transporter|nr:TonB-dependent receptor [Zoogloeaceae bacterium]
MSHVQSRFRGILPAALTLIVAPGALAADRAAIDSAELDPLIFIASRQPMRASEVLADVTVVGREEIEAAGQSTIVDLLARQHGIQTYAQGGPGKAASFFVRGANSDQLKVLVDGIPINSIDGSGSPLRYLPLADVERIEILRGAAATLYGADAIGGVIQIVTRRGQPGLQADAFVGYGSHNTRQAAAGISGGNEHWRFRVEANHYATDGFSAQRHATNKDADDDAYRNTGGALSFSFLPTTDHEFGASYRQNSGTVHYDSGNVPPWGNNDGTYDYRDHFKTRQWQVFAKNRFFEGRWQSTLRYGEALDDQKNYGWDDWAYPLPAETRSRLWTRTRLLSWQNDVRLPLGTLLAAVEKQKQNIRPRDEYANADMDNTAFLLGWTARLGDHGWQLNARSDDHSRYGRESTWGLAYGYQITPEWRARASVGTSFKAPSLYQLYTKYYGYGNPDLKPEKASNREVALVWERAGQQATLTLYRNRVKDLIDSDPVTWQATNARRARLSGATLAYAGQFGDWKLGASYDYLNAKKRDADGNWVWLGRRARHVARLTVDRDWSEKFRTGVELLAVGRRYDGTYAKSASNKEELGGYTLVNLTARYALTRDLKLEARLNNLFDKQYETARYYSTDDGFNAFVGLRYELR